MPEMKPTTMLQNAQGHYVPVDKIKPLDMQRNDLVNSIVQKAQKLRAEMQNFKDETSQDLQAHIALSAEQYNAKVGGAKGNMQLLSFNGEFKVQIAITDSLVFDERLQIAKSLIDECIHEWTTDSNSNAKALIEHAFQTDKAGNISVSRVLGMLKLNMDHPKWTQAMNALRDSIQVQSSKSYLRIYRRNTEGKYEQLSLDLANI